MKLFTIFCCLSKCSFQLVCSFFQLMIMFPLLDMFVTSLLNFPGTNKIFNSFSIKKTIQVINPLYHRQPPLMATIFIIPSSSSLFQLYHNHSYASSSYHLYHYYHSINLYHRLHIASSLLSSCDYYCHDNPHNIILIIILVET